MSQPLISLCMIVRDEEVCLPRAIANWKEIADEFVLVDTGSKDATIEIATEAGAKILCYDWVWPGHKGAARNMGIEAATGDFIVILDADEVICEPLAIRQILEANREIDALNVQFNNYIGEQISLSWYQVRVFRRGKFNYVYREHETPIAIDSNMLVETTDIIFEHRTPVGRAGKSESMLARLATDVGENPNDPHPLYFYHRECLIQEHNEKCIELGKQYLEMTKNGGFIQSDIYGNMAIAYQRLDSINEARKYLHLAAACEPFNREWLYRLGAFHVDCGEWNVALAMLKAAAEILPKKQRQWEPMTTTRIYQMIDRCQHQMAHSH